MRSVKIFIVVFCLSLFVFACVQKKPKQLSVQESVRPEASFFRANCVLCHGAEAQGRELSDKRIPSLREGEAARKSDEELYEQIANGKNGMPPFKYQLTDAQIRNMVRFIRDLQKENY